MEYILQYLKSTEAYDVSSQKCYAFRKGHDKVDGLSLRLGNMVSGFPFDIEDIRFHNSEAAYIAGAFSDGSTLHRNIQNELQRETNGFLAKKIIRRNNESIKRPDWEEFNIQWMLYCVWCKCFGNETFRNILLSLPDDCIIIEDSTFQKGSASTFWGAKNSHIYSLHKSLSKTLKSDGIAKSQRNKILDKHRLEVWNKEGIYTGCNCMGKILMLCRDALINGSMPEIDFDLLRRKHINFFGTILTFENEKELNIRA